VANEIILKLDVTMESSDPSPEVRGFRKILEQKLVGLFLLERDIAKRRSRVLWLSEGHVCTRFFHLHAKHKMLNSFIAHIKVDGVLVTNKDDKGKAVDTFYDQLFDNVTCIERTNNEQLAKKI
jgi:hypothetical protein